MQIIKLLLSTSTKDEFVEVIENNKELIFDYFSIINFSQLLESKEEFRKLSLKCNLLYDEDLNSDSLNSFILLVLNASIRLGDRFVFQGYYKLSQFKKLSTSLLIDSSTLFMINVRGFNDFESRTGDIMNKLEEVFRIESDTKKDAISSLVSFYAIIVDSFYEFASEKVREIGNKILKEYELKTYSFMDEEIIADIFDFKLLESVSPYNAIHDLLNAYLKNEPKVRYNNSSFLVETDSKYSELIKSKMTLSQIVSLNRSHFESQKSDELYYSLDRGVGILEYELQLFQYMYSFGRMHYEKLKSAIEVLPQIAINHTVVDWGCGQGLATLKYLEYQNLSTNSILIEPSLVALKRATLHIKHWVPNISTINKVFDDLIDSDFEIARSSTTTHLMSNILDIEMYSLMKLIGTIESNFEGRNYFIVTSPYIDYTRTKRIETFVSHFQKYPSFKLVLSITEKKGDWVGTNWSRVLRVFEVDI